MLTLEKKHAQSQAQEQQGREEEEGRREREQAAKAAQSDAMIEEYTAKLQEERRVRESLEEALAKANSQVEQLRAQSVSHAPASPSSVPAPLRVDSPAGSPPNKGSTSEPGEPTKSCPACSTSIPMMSAYCLSCGASQVM